MENYFFQKYYDSEERVEEKVKLGYAKKIGTGTNKNGDSVSVYMIPGLLCDSNSFVCFDAENKEGYHMSLIQAKYGALTGSQKRISDVHIPDGHGKGYGTLLINETLSWLATQHIKAVELDIDTTQGKEKTDVLFSYYKKLGFSTFAEGHTLMSKTL